MKSELVDIFPSTREVNEKDIQYDSNIKRLISYNESKSLRNWILDLQEKYCSPQSYVNSSSQNIFLLSPQIGNLGIIFTWSKDTFKNAIIPTSTISKHNIKLFRMDKYIIEFEEPPRQILENNYSQYPGSIVFLDLINDAESWKSFETEKLLDYILETLKCPMLILLQNEKFQISDESSKKYEMTENNKIFKNGEYLYSFRRKLKNHVLSYPSAQSLSQISKLSRNTEYWKRLEKFLSNKVERHVVTQTLDTVLDMIDRGSDDFRIYNKMNQLFEKYLKTESNRATYRIQEIERFLGKKYSIKFENLLDVGCAEGSITVELGQLFLKTNDSTHLFGCDVRKISDESLMQFSLLRDDGKLPYSDDQFEIITCFMTLHHILDHQEILKEIYRVLKPGGYLLIREHSSTKDFGLYLDVLHAMYAMVLTSPQEWPDFCQTYVALYFSQQEWTRKIIDCGLLELEKSPPVGNMQWYYALYRKPNKRKVDDRDAEQDMPSKIVSSAEK